MVLDIFKLLLQKVASLAAWWISTPLLWIPAWDGSSSTKPTVSNMVALNRTYSSPGLQSRIMTICQLEEKTACFQKVDSYFIHLLSLTLLFISDSNDPVPKSKQTQRPLRANSFSSCNCSPNSYKKISCQHRHEKNNLQASTESGVVIWFLKLPLKNK